MARFSETKEAFLYIESFTNFEREPLKPFDRRNRLDRMRALLAHFGNPHETFSSLHVAGTKGKGSTAMFLASALQEAGQRVGLYMSPHVVSYDERISVDLAPVDRGVLIDVAARIADAVDSGAIGELPGGESPTTFELLTLLAFMCFRESGCRYAVVEVGIGGRLDATNVVSPLVSLITPLDLEHTDLLGDSLDKIAYEKGGIIKAGTPVYCGYQEPVARKVFQEIAASRNAPITFLDDEISGLEAQVSAAGTQVELRLRGISRTFRLAMPGRFQAENAALAYLVLHDILPWMDERAIERGLSRARLPGRMEIVGVDPPLMLDAAHTPLAVRRLLESYTQIEPRQGVLVFGSVAGKRPAEMARILAPAFRHVIVTTPGTFKRSDPQEVWQVFKAVKGESQLAPDPAEALRLAYRLSARDGGLPILVTGSFYLLGVIRQALADFEAAVQIH